MSTEKFRWTNSPVSGSKANAEPATLALPPTNSKTDRPWNRAGCVCTTAFQAAVPLHGTNAEKKPVSAEPACICFNCPEMFTNVGCEHVTEPFTVATPVVGFTDPNCAMLGAIENGGGP